MKINKTYLLLIIFILTIAFRLYFSFQTPEYSDSESYLHLRQIEHIKENYRPMTYDSLSFGGRHINQLQVFNFLIAGFSFIPHAYKIVPTVLISLTVLIAYLLALRITNNPSAAVLSALMVAFLPSTIVPTLNKLSIFSLMLPLSLYMVYCLIRIEEKKFLNQFVVLCFALPVIHPLAFLVSASFFTYIILVFAEPKINLSALRKEAIIFSIFVALLIEFIIYKKSFLALGLGVLWQNIPAQALAENFKQINLLDIIYSVGVIPFIFGIIGILFGIIRDKTHNALIMTSIIVSPLALLGLEIISLEDSLIVLGPALAIMSAISMKKFFSYLRITKFSRYESLSKYLLFVLIVFTIIMPTYSTAKGVIKDTITEDEVELLKTLDLELDNDVVIASSAEEGHYITYFANRKNVIDENFQGIQHAESKYKNIKTLYTTISGSEAMEIVEKYDIGYIYLSPRTKETFNIEELAYTTDEKCFRKTASSGEVKAYKIRC